MTRTAVLLVVLAGCQTGSAREAAAPAAQGAPAPAVAGPPAVRPVPVIGVLAPRLVATVSGEPVRAVVPPHLDADPEAYRAFTRQLVYRTAVRQRAAAAGVTLDAAERAAALASVPPPAAMAAWLAGRGESYADAQHEALAVALIQKMERREVFDKIAIGEAEIAAIFAERQADALAPRRYLTALALRTPGCSAAQLAAGRALAAVLAGASVDGHRVDAAAAARAAGLGPADVWAIDVHLDANWQVAAAEPLDRGDGAAPPFGPDHITALAIWAQDTQEPVYAAECREGTVWTARFVDDTRERPLELADVADEIEAALRAERERPAFAAWVEQVLATTPADLVALEEVPR
jgi:hypothetical protein